MDAIKPWYLSRTIWASVVTVGAAVLGLAGHAVEATDQGMLTDAILQGITAVSGVVAVAGRLGATRLIGGRS